MRQKLFFTFSALIPLLLLASFIPTPKPDHSMVFEDEESGDFDDWETEGLSPTPQSTSTPKIHSLGETNLVAQTTDKKEPPKEAAKPETDGSAISPILINFNNVSIIEYIRFVSRLTNKNFIFDEEDLQFTVTIVSEEATTLDNIMTALLQELRIHDMTMIEQGNNIIIHKNDQVNSISKVKLQGEEGEKDSDIITQVFTLNTLDPEKAAVLIRPLTSKQSIIEASKETQHLIITDLVTNVNKIDKLLKGIDAPSSGLVIGQYLAKNTQLDTLVKLAQELMAPIAKEQPMNFVTHPPAQSIFIVSTPYLVEKTITVLQRLDQYQGKTEIFDLDKMKMAKPQKGTGEGEWESDVKGNKVFRPNLKSTTDEFPKGEWLLDPNGNWYFLPEGQETPFGASKPATPILPGEQPKGKWSLDPRGGWVFQLSPGEPVTPNRLTRQAKLQEDLPVGHIERTQFYVHKLQYQKGDQVLTAIENMSSSLASNERTNEDLIAALNSVQWLEYSNTLIFTGYPNALAKAKELVDEIDVPAKQVFIEMLILETDLDDSLTYGVEFLTRSGGGNTSTAQAFIGSASPLPGAMDTTGTIFKPNANTLARKIGYHLGVIGQRLTHGGTQYASLGALVSAEHTRGKSKIIMNPKILTEDNVAAEIFVGINTPYQTDSIVNDQGSIVTTNFEFRDVGTRMRVTPHIANNNDYITLVIEQEVSREAGTGGFQGGTNIQNQPAGPTTSINRTNTTVHIPNRYFLVMSGMLQNESVHTRTYLPCLGAVPIIGAAFSTKNNTDAKRNIMIFLRPEIVESKEEINDITKREQNIYDEANQTKKSWKYQVDEGLDFLNIRRDCCEDCEY